MNHAQKPLARALLGRSLEDETGDHAGPSFTWRPVPLAWMLNDARRLSEVFDLGPTVETLEQVASLTEARDERRN
jgi:hypothetical protein